MCRWRQETLNNMTTSVRNVYLKCGHAENLYVQLLQFFNVFDHTSTLKDPVRQHPLQIQPEPPGWVCPAGLQQEVQSIVVVCFPNNIVRRTNFLYRVTLKTEKLPMWTDFVRLVPAPWVVATNCPRSE
ncbi:hypothetical protein B0H11DRAFT_1921694 [Mycena galericulata]|nr:hypothetical protein B0H11DRAFT_1921694 [Mycena galericulata]